MIILCVAAYTESREQTVDQFIDEIYSQFGYFAEKTSSLVFEAQRDEQNRESDEIIRSRPVRR